MVDHSGWRVGVASAPIHHGEILQGVFPHRGQLTRGLVTMPCTVHTTQASFIPARGEELTVSPPWKTKARRAAQLAVEACVRPGDGPVGGHLELTGDVPLCRGFGSSTSDVLAAIWAVQDALVRPLRPEDVARIAVRAETASDSLMFKESSVLFAQREGKVIEDFGYRMPAVRVLGFGSRPENDGRGVDTLALPPAHYDRTEVGVFAELQAMLREAIHTKDVALVGAVASASTGINQRHLPIPLLDSLRAVERETGALGIQTAHSGDIAGLLYDRDDPEVAARTEHGRQLLHDIGIHEQWIFTTGD
ncbi:kinase [Streptomyces caelestis]|uniref:Kinase n=1 Tax=Streptomyces caelestis TaxID=36816 RepID=A0A0M8QIC0_9ACTN|nr:MULTISPECIES: kinase [Streptomyces]KOT33995.1 kinase [Streptomyces caelestis]KOV23539.1 kinase [Streptomyces sp. XY152]